MDSQVQIKSFCSQKSARYIKAKKKKKCKYKPGIFSLQEEKKKTNKKMKKKNKKTFYHYAAYTSTLRQFQRCLFIG